MSEQVQSWSASRSIFWGILALALLVGGTGTWSVSATLSGAIIAHGEIEVSQNRQVVQHPDGGVVQGILVREGMRVAAGDVLMRLDSSEIESELAIFEDQFLELSARRSRLEAQTETNQLMVFPADLIEAAKRRADVTEILEGQQSLFDSQAEMVAQAMDQRQTRVGQIESQIEGIVAQQQAVRTQIGLLETELATQLELLAKGLTQSARVSSLNRELAQLSGRLGELTSAQADAAGRITEIEIEITALVTQQREKAEAELRDVAARLLEIEQRRRALIERMSRLEIKSPASGLVLGLQVTTPRAVIRPADALMFIVPQDRPLIVAARVPVTHVDEVYSGQDVRLVFSGLPTRFAPEVFGKVTMVSADALSDELTGTKFFLAEVAIDPTLLKELGDVQIVPGMPVDVYIRTADRSPMSYLLKPFSDYFRTAFRET